MLNFFYKKNQKLLQLYIKDIIINHVNEISFDMFMCLSGEIGRRTGLKILRESNPVPVQVRP